MWKSNCMVAATVLLLRVALLSHYSTAQDYSLSSIEVLDLYATDPTLAQFNGGFTDGSFGYVVPHSNPAYFGKIARFSLTDFSSVAVLDLNPQVGFNGGFSDGTYGYLVPALNDGVVRFTLQSFGDVAVLSLGITDPSLKGFIGGFGVGGYGYLAPYHNGIGKFGKLVRFTLTDFTIAGVLDLTLTDPHLKGFIGGFTDGVHGYVVPHHNDVGSFGRVARFSLLTFGNVLVIDLPATDPELVGFRGGFSDGKYGYLAPADHGKVPRFNLQQVTTVDILDLFLTDSTLTGFLHGFVDGVYGYLCPQHEQDFNTKSGKIVRFELTTFSGVTVLDLTSSDPSLKGFHGGFTDGRYGYLVPHENGAPSSKIVRFVVSQTTTTTTSTATTSTTTTITTTSTTTPTPTTTSTSLMSGTSTSSMAPPASEVIACSLVLNVTSAEQFAQDPEVKIVLRSAVAQLLDVNASWIHNLTITPIDRRRLSLFFSSQGVVGHENDRKLNLEITTKSGVNVEFDVVVPPDGGPGEVTAAIIMDQFDAKSIEEATDVINQVIQSGALGSKNYEVTIVAKKVNLVSDEPTPAPTPSSSEKPLLKTIVIAVILVSVCLVVLALSVCLLAKALASRERDVEHRPKLLENNSNCVPFSDLQLLAPPEDISSECKESLCEFLSTMLDGSDPDVIVSFGAGQRSGDAVGSGPGLFYAAGTIRALSRYGIPCFCALPNDALENACLNDLLLHLDTSCRMLVVVETRALYSCRTCLMQIYKALMRNITVLRVRFEDNLPENSDWWSGLDDADAEWIGMRSKVQRELELGLVVPDPPATVQSSGDFLDSFAIDLARRLASEGYVDLQVNLFSKCGQPTSPFSTDVSHIPSEKCADKSSVDASQTDSEEKCLSVKSVKSESQIATSKKKKVKSKEKHVGSAIVGKSLSSSKASPKKERRNPASCPK